MPDKTHIQGFVASAAEESRCAWHAAANQLVSTQVRICFQGVWQDLRGGQYKWHNVHSEALEGPCGRPTKRKARCRCGKLLRTVPLTRLVNELCHSCLPKLHSVIGTHCHFKADCSRLPKQERPPPPCLWGRLSQAWTIFGCACHCV